MNNDETASETPAEKPILSQLDKFKHAARELGTDDDPERFKALVKKIGSAKPTVQAQSQPKPR